MGRPRGKSPRKATWRHTFAAMTPDRRQEIWDKVFDTMTTSSWNGVWVTREEVLEAIPFVGGVAVKPEEFSECMRSKKNKAALGVERSVVDGTSYYRWMIPAERSSWSRLPSVQEQMASTPGGRTSARPSSPTMLMHPSSPVRDNPPEASLASPAVATSTPRELAYSPPPSRLKRRRSRDMGGVVGAPPAKRAGLRGIMTGGEGGEVAEGGGGSASGDSTVGLVSAMVTPLKGRRPRRSASGKPLTVAFNPEVRVVFVEPSGPASDGGMEQGQGERKGGWCTVS
ncbi:unnamed protein product [Discosporangium mesarthrocarpum]